MTTHTSDGSGFDRLFHAALQCERAGRLGEAQALSLQALDASPGHAQATLLAARFAAAGRQFGRAAELLQAGLARHPGHVELAIQLALALAATDRPHEAVRTLSRTVLLCPQAHHAWLYLSLLCDRAGDAAGGLKAAYQAVTLAQRAGEWTSESSTPPELLKLVVRAVERVRLGRRELFLASFAPLRQQHGAAALARMDRALAAYLSEGDAVPPDPHQRPRFFYFPDLPSTAYNDPALQPWSKQLREAFPQIRREALQVLEAERQTLPDFITTANASGQNQHLTGTSAPPSWRAFFFYRRGRRFDQHHARCPVTSRVLEAAALCRIADQAPEICFSVLGPGTHIKPHHGVTNTRLVMHLPLIVPADCALNVHGGGVHRWVEGEPVMFDDTFLHEAWNRSTQPRVVLLMDCWNPHLTPVERDACTRLVEMISSLTPRAEGDGTGA